MSLTTFSTEQLLTIQALVTNALSGTPSAAGKTQIGKNGKPVKLTKSGKVSKRNGKPTVHGDFTKYILSNHKEQIATFKSENPDQKGAHLVYVAKYRKDNADEYSAFEAKWKEEHPPTEESDADSDVPSETLEVNTEGKVKKPRAPLTQEHKDAMQAGRLKKKAEKEAAKAALEQNAINVAAPVAAPVTVTAPIKASSVPLPASPSGKKKPKSAKKAEEIVAPVPPVSTPVDVEQDEQDEFLPFTHKDPTSKVSTKYIRMGQRRPDGNHIWASTDLWLSVKGAKGAYKGQLLPDGTIDTTVEEPEIEME
jgi:hypothetical protein